MARFGICIYPEHSTQSEIKKYIEKSAKAGCKRIFSCLLSVEKSKNEIIDEFRDWIDYAHSFDMEVILDVAPFVFQRLGITYNDLSFFNEIHADGIRLDEGFDGMKEAVMTYNPYELKIEINASTGTKYLENILSYNPRKDRIITCHNFYPQRYTGLSQEHFENTSKYIKSMNFNVAAFVTSQNENTFGPWNVSEGLCTLENHRNLPLHVQIRHMFAMGFIDDVIIANCYASDNELDILSKIDPYKLTFTVDKEYELSDVEMKILYEHEHIVRGDISEYMARSTQPRITFKNSSIKPCNTRDIKKGDVIILNYNYDRYKGELHVAFKDMKNDGNKNVIGRIPENEIILIDYMKPWTPFKFINI